MRLHSKLPLVAILGLVHLGVTLPVLVLGRTGGSNDGGIHDGASLEHQALLGQRGVDRGQYLRRQLILVQQVESAGWGSRRAYLQSGGPRAVRAALPPWRIAEVPPHLQAVDAQHGFDGKWWTPAQSVVRATSKGSNECNQR